MRATTIALQVLMAVLAAGHVSFLEGQVHRDNVAQPKKALTTTTQPENSPQIMEKERQSPPQVLPDDVIALKAELESLRNDQQQKTLVRADSTISFAYYLICTVGVMFTILAVFTGISGLLAYLGFRSWRDFELYIKRTKQEFDAHIVKVAELEGRLAGDIAELSRKSETVIAVSYNFNTGRLASKRGEYLMAREYYERALRLQQDNVKVLYEIGRTCTELGDSQAAIDFFQKMLNQEQNNADALRGIASAYRYIDLDKSIEFAQRATETEKVDSKALDYLGILYRDKMRIEEAIQVHERALTAGQRPETNFLLSLLYAHNGDIEGAKCMMHAAYRSLPKARAEDRVPALWDGLIQCGKAIIENSADVSSLGEAKIRPWVFTKRAALSIKSHFSFLFAALGRSKELNVFLESVVRPDLLPEKEVISNKSEGELADAALANRIPAKDSGDK